MLGRPLVDVDRQCHADAMTDRDPWAETFADIEPDDSGPETITNGATVLSVEHHPVYGRFYRCRAWMAHHPWTLERKSSPSVYRGDPFDNPELVGAVDLARLRRRDVDVQSVPVGAADDAIEVDVWVSGTVEPSPGDTLAF